MLYLWIFGNNIEAVLGKFRFILFYFVCGTIAALGHIATDMDSQIPMVGASGAISGILGAYLILFPFARIKTFIFLGIYWTIARVPAIVLLLIWIGLQIWNSVATGVEEQHGSHILEGSLPGSFSFYHSSIFASF